MNINKLVLATHNKGKVREIAEMLAGGDVEVVSCADFGVDEPEETGTTFRENALIKALNSASKTGLPSLADDSGMSVEALGGAPGVYSKDWAGDSVDFAAAMARVERELLAKGAEPEGAKAHFTCCLCLAYPGGEHEFFVGEVHGRLTFPPRGAKGFGYDPIFIPDGFDITFGEMDEAEKNKISHRARALGKLRAQGPGIGGLGSVSAFYLTPES